MIRTLFYFLPSTRRWEPTLSARMGHIHEERWREWRRQRAQDEIRDWLRRLPLGSTDQIKEDPEAYRYTRSGAHGAYVDPAAYTAGRVKGTEWEEPFKEKAQSVRDRWDLPTYVQLL